MAKEYFQENVLNTELIHAYAKNSKVTDLEKIVNGPNVVNIQGIGDKYFNEELPMFPITRVSETSASIMNYIVPPRF